MAKSLHWIIVALVTTQYITKLVSPETFAGVTDDGLDAWHLAVGPTILLLMLARFGWRLTHRPPPPPPKDLLPALQLLSRLTHWLFYGVLIVIPILGWFSASAFGAHPTLLFLFKTSAHRAAERTHRGGLGRCSWPASVGVAGGDRAACGGGFMAWAGA